MGMNHRIAWIDAWKGLLILLVVLGHVVGAMYHYADGTSRVALGVVYRAIYLFHMPAFFFVAGYLWRQHEDWSFGVCFKKRVKRLVIPYLFWGFMSALVFVVAIVFANTRVQGADGYYGAKMFDFQWWRPFASIIHAGDWPKGEGFRCNSVLWFLPCLFMVLIMYDCIDHGVQNFCKRKGNVINVLLVVVCFAIAALLRFSRLNFLPWGLSRAPFFLLFFSLGRLSRDTRILERQIIKGWLIPCGWLFMFLIAWNCPDLWHAYTTWRWYAYSVGAAGFGCLLSFWTAKAVADKWLGAGLSILGISSMGIMLLHKFLLMPLQMMCQRLSFSSVYLLCLGVVVITVLVAVIAELLSRIIQKVIPWSFGER